MMKRGVGQWGERMMGTDGGIHTREAKGIQAFSKHQGGTIDQNIQGPCAYFDSERQTPLRGYPGPQPTFNLQSCVDNASPILKNSLGHCQEFRRVTLPYDISERNSRERFGGTGLHLSRGPTFRRSSVRRNDLGRYRLYEDMSASNLSGNG